MTRINIDTAPPAVKKFIRSLSISADGMELTLDGSIVCRIMPPGQLSNEEKATQLEEVRNLLDIARENSKRLAAKEIEQRIRGTLKAVRKGR